MIALDVSKLLGIEFAEEFNTATQKKESAPAIVNRSTSTEPTHKELCVKELDEIESLLEKIPASCSYDEWFHVAAALKRKGVDYEVFRRWSATSSEKYDEAACERTWNGAADPTKPAVTLATLQQYANRYSGVEQERLEMLPPPETMEEMTNQTLEFLDMFFKPGESFELVSKTWNQGGRTIPSRPGTLITMPESYMQLYSQLYSEIARCNDGAWFVFNPLRSKLEGTSARDADVTEFRYVLIEADSKTKEEQWEQLVRMHLPIKAVVWSGGKSLHAFIKIDAGTERALYNERVRKLYDFLESKNMDIDKANKNPCRLSRIPGFFRGDDMQYLVAREMGSKDWDTFERLYLNKRQYPEEVDSSDNGALLIERYGAPFAFTKSGDVQSLNQSFFAAYTKQFYGLLYSTGYFWKYESATGLWKEVDNQKLCILIADAIRFYAKKNDIDISHKITASLCSNVLIFIEKDEIDHFKKKDMKYIHVANGVVVFSKEGSISFQPFAPEFYSRNRCEINYDPQATCPRFIEKLLQPAIPDDDIKLLQVYSGQCLLADNLTQTLLVISGTAGGGKGSILRIIEDIVGNDNHVELRTDHLGDRFELSNYIGKSLAVGNDVDSDFLLRSYAGRIKSLCGHDQVTAEIKNGGMVTLEGRFNMIITANDRLKLKLDGDAAAWKRRVLWIPFERPPVKNRIPDFDKILLKEEGSGILNWMIEGATKLLAEGIPQNTTSAQRVEDLLQESDSIYGFLRARVEPAEKSDITEEELYASYSLWCYRNNWTPIRQRDAKSKLQEGIMTLFQVPRSNDLWRIVNVEDSETRTKCFRGFHKLKIRKSDINPDNPDTECEVNKSEFEQLSFF